MTVEPTRLPWVVCPVASIMEDTKQWFLLGHEWSPSTCNIQGICLAVTVYTVLLNALCTVSCNPHTNSRRQLLVSSFCRGNSRGLKTQSPVTRNEIVTSSLAPNSLQLQSPCCSVPHHRAEDRDYHCGVSHRHKSTLSPDNRFHHSWNWKPGKKEDCWLLEPAFPEGG